jgi:hypothetical protein
MRSVNRNGRLTQIGKFHEASNKHIVDKGIFKSIEAPENQPARKMLTILRKDDIEKLSHLFRTALSQILFGFVS